MAFEIKKWLKSIKAIQFIGLLACIAVLLVGAWIIMFFWPAIVNGLEIQNGTFNISSSTREMQNAFSASDLISSVVMGCATVIYVILTALLFISTNKNTEQTANTQKIEYLERRLHLFYLPMQRALKKINMRELRINLDKISLMEKRNDLDAENSGISKIFRRSLSDMFCEYDKEYMTLMQFSYFATDETNEYLNGFIDVFNEQIVDDVKLVDNFNKVRVWYFGENIDNKTKYDFAVTDKKSFFNYYVLLQLQTEGDIKSIKDELAKLVNL